jgi:dTDP-4-dehydrorhamnose reductase
MTIYVFGSTGMLGAYVVKVLKSYYKVVCITRDKFDILNDSWDKLAELLDTLTITASDVIVNCAGVIPQKMPAIQGDGQRGNNCKIYFRINTIFPHKLQQLSEKIGYKFIHITTDCVFNGQYKLGKRFLEFDCITRNMSTDIYGISKLLGEPLGACVIRTSIIGEEMQYKKSLLEWVKSNAGKTIDGFDNHYWNGITCLTLANIIGKIIGKKLYWRGVRHIYTHCIVSKYELCKIINDIYQLNITIKKIDTPRICNRTLSSIYNTNMLFHIPNIRQQIFMQKEFS